MKEIFLKPLGDYKIPDPVTGEALPRAGDLVAHSTYWQRRINAGEVEVVKLPKPKGGK